MHSILKLALTLAAVQPLLAAPLIAIKREEASVNDVDIGFHLDATEVDTDAVPLYWKRTENDVDVAFTADSAEAGAEAVPLYWKTIKREAGSNDVDVAFTADAAEAGTDAVPLYWRQVKGKRASVKN